MIRHLVPVGLIIATTAGSVQAKPSMREVPQIDDGLFVIGLAHEISKKCPTISARLFKGIGALHDLKREASSLGYTDDEIRAHVESDVEKQRMRDRAATYMKARGLGQTKQDFCALGQDEIAQKSQIGALLRAR